MNHQISLVDWTIGDHKVKGLHTRIDDKREVMTCESLKNKDSLLVRFRNDGKITDIGISFTAIEVLYNLFAAHKMMIEYKKFNNPPDPNDELSLAV